MVKLSQPGLSLSQVRASPLVVKLEWVHIHLSQCLSTFSRVGLCPSGPSPSLSEMAQAQIEPNWPKSKSRQVNVR